MRQTLKLMVILTSAAAVCMAGGCEATMDLPDGFVKVDRQYSQYDMRAVSADGVALSVRTEDNPQDGTLEFWSQAVSAELEGRQGYTLVDNSEVGPAGNPDGVMMEFDVVKRGNNMKYLVAVFVQTGQVVVAEAAGPAEAVTPTDADIRKALLSAR